MIHWIDGEQWTISETEASNIAQSASVLIAAPTGCDRTQILAAHKAASTKQSCIALFFTEGSEQHDLLYERSCIPFRENDWTIHSIDLLDIRVLAFLIRDQLEQIAPKSTVLVDTSGMPVEALFIIGRMVEQSRCRIMWLYVEASKYLRGRHTDFSSATREVSPIQGFGFSTDIDDEGILIVLAGYGTSSIASVAEYRKGSKPRYLIVPFPSVQAQMYQECVLSTKEAMHELKLQPSNRSQVELVAAHDLWSTVETLDRLVKLHPNRCISIAPLSTKPHALGVLYWWLTLAEAQREFVSILTPRFAHRSWKVSTGTGRIWLYTPPEHTDQ